MTDQSARATRIALHPPFRHLGGHQWLAELPNGSLGPGDSSAAPVGSLLALYEDGTALGPRHAMHADIEQQGGGRYSHWDGNLRFSSSDGSDPNANGRHYAVALDAPPLRVIGFGSCHLHQAILNLQGRGAIHNLWPDAAVTYTLLETLQVLRHHSGAAPLPPRLQPLTVGATRPPEAVGAGGVDVLFLELGSSIDIAFGPLWLARSELHKELMNKFSALGRMQHRAAHRWYHQGLMRQSEAARQDGAARLLDALPDIQADAFVARDVIRNARGQGQNGPDQLATLEAIRALVGARAICVLCAYNAFTPDGRPLSWPANYPRQLDALCRDARLPLLHPSTLVTRHGVAFALEPDRYHFSDAFIGVLADELLAMARQELGEPAARAEG